MEMADMQTIAGKLLVLVPVDELDESRYARKARQLAEAHNLDILFIGINQSAESEPQARLKLVTLSGIAGTNSISSSFTMVDASSWLDVIRREFKPGDRIMCPSEFNTNSFYMKDSEDLRSALAGKVHFVSGMLTSSDRERIEKITRLILNWGGILAIIALGFFLEVDFDSQTMGVGKTVAEIAIFTAEIGLLWWWNTFVSRLNY
jgi:hypothetical protein